MKEILHWNCTERKRKENDFIWKNKWISRIIAFKMKRKKSTIVYTEVLKLCLKKIVWKSQFKQKLELAWVCLFDKWFKSAKKETIKKFVRRSSMWREFVCSRILNFLWHQKREQKVFRAQNPMKIKNKVCGSIYRFKHAYS